MITKYMNFNGKVIWVKDKVAGQPVKLCDNSKLKSHLPNFNFTSIEDGLKDTVNWFLKSKDTNG
jgi:GDP-L-fucose synthase